MVCSINRTTQNQPPMFFTLLSIESSPLLSFSPNGFEVGAPELALETPEITPQASISSPDISGLSSTPGGAPQISTPPPNTGFNDPEAEARLIDITDETWGLVLNPGMDDSCSAFKSCPALASGYLLKRAGPRDQDGLLRIEVNVVHAPKSHRPPLKALLAMYRNLGLLARIRGIVDPVKSVIPIHIAMARKAHKAVTASMRYEDEG